MKESLTPEKIQTRFIRGSLSRESATELLQSLIESSENTEIRVESIKTLEKIDFQSENLYKFLENYLISDENAVVRASVANYLIHNFLDTAIPALRWIIQHEKSPIVLKIVFDFLKNNESPKLNVIKNDFKNWNNKFASKIGIIPKESLFFLDLEVLFSNRKENYEINPGSFKHMKTLSDTKTSVPWIVIKNKHIELLNLNFFKWNFVRNNEDIIKSLSNLQDLSVYLNSLKKYSNNDLLTSNIPESIGSLTKLKNLILRRNGLIKLPISFKNLTSLEELDLSYNNFKEVPQVLISLNKLKKLNIKYNLIQKIPKALFNNIKIIR